MRLNEFVTNKAGSSHYPAPNVIKIESTSARDMAQQQAFESIKRVNDIATVRSKVWIFMSGFGFGWLALLLVMIFTDWVSR